MSTWHIRTLLAAALVVTLGLAIRAQAEHRRRRALQAQAEREVRIWLKRLSAHHEAS